MYTEKIIRRALILLLATILVVVACAVFSNVGIAGGIAVIATMLFAGYVALTFGCILNSITE